MRSPPLTTPSRKNPISKPTANPSEIGCAGWATLPSRILACCSQRLTQRIQLVAGTVRDNLFKLKNLVDEAKNSNVWSVLGFESWTAYLADTLGSEPMRLQRVERRELVDYLSGEGMSTRAIAPIVGADQATVVRDIARDANASPEHGAEPDRQHPRPVVGLDGKEYVRRPVSWKQQAIRDWAKQVTPAKERGTTADAVDALMDAIELVTYAAKIMAGSDRVLDVEMRKAITLGAERLTSTLELLVSASVEGGVTDAALEELLATEEGEA